MEAADTEIMIIDESLRPALSGPGTIERSNHGIAEMRTDKGLRPFFSSESPPWSPSFFGAITSTRVGLDELSGWASKLVNLGNHLLQST